MSYKPFLIGGKNLSSAIVEQKIYTACNYKKGYKQLFERMTGIAFDKYVRIDLPNTIAEIAKWFEFAQPAKYMLYNDCLQGLYDSTVTLGDYKKFKSRILNKQKINMHPTVIFTF